MQSITSHSFGTKKPSHDFSSFILITYLGFDVGRSDSGTRLTAESSTILVTLCQRNETDWFIKCSESVTWFSKNADVIVVVGKRWFTPTFLSVHLYYAVARVSKAIKDIIINSNKYLKMFLITNIVTKRSNTFGYIISGI